MPARPLTAAQKFLIEPLLFSRRTTAYVARQTGLDAEAIEQWRKARHAVRQAARNATRKAQRAAQGKASRVPRGTRPRQTLPAVPASWRRHPADAPLTAAQQAYLEPLVLKRTTTAALARQTGLPAATIEEWRKRRAQAVRRQRDRDYRRGLGVVSGAREGSDSALRDDRLLAALVEHMPPAGDVFAPLGRPVSIGRGMAA